MADRLKEVFAVFAEPDSTVQRQRGVRVWEGRDDGYREWGTGHVFRGGEVVVVCGDDDGSPAGAVAAALGQAVEVTGPGGDNPWPPPPPPPAPEAPLQVYGKNPWPPPPPPPPARGSLDDFVAKLRGWFHRAGEGAENHF